MADRGARERMVFSAAQLLRRHGATATGMRDVVAHAAAPRGSLGHYFPGGKQQLVSEAVEWAGRYAGNRVSRFRAELGGAATPGGLFAAMANQWVEEWDRVGFEAGGCPVAAATVDCADENTGIRAAVAEAFTAWRGPVADTLVELGVPSERAASLATLMVGALEGAILIARAERDPRALHVVVAELTPLLDGGRA